ncbi:hypothetical protein EJ06DRAFT_583555 [Trichodelitschia bisporula]|uniref:Uncharacterized protein n=1 Tax=Trichodelitschia bisporula TaxID=703511 RepID=A0A6G1HR94_9PEZI|nr:hypothetical protein EJ06DRAFT_583555 [Trichodelitschia bisporula]
MASPGPLLPLSSNSLNARQPDLLQFTPKKVSSEKALSEKALSDKVARTPDEDEITWDELPSSPFITEVSVDNKDKDKAVESVPSPVFEEVPAESKPSPAPEESLVDTEMGDSIENGVTHEETREETHEEMYEETYEETRKETYEVMHELPSKSLQQRVYGDGDEYPVNTYRSADEETYEGTYEETYEETHEETYEVTHELPSKSLEKSVCEEAGDDCPKDTYRYTDEETVTFKTAHSFADATPNLARPTTPLINSPLKHASDPQPKPADSPGQVDNSVFDMTEIHYDPEHSVLRRAEDTEIGDSTGLDLHVDDTIDDTCFSTFSEVQNADMTKFAQLGQSATKKNLFDQTPRLHHSQTLRTERRLPTHRSPSPTSKRSRREDNDTTNLLLDFTQQFESVSALSRSMKARSPAKSNGVLSYLNSQRSPQKPPSTPAGSKGALLNLLDFELPPAPTPRSIPSITIRELESLKSRLGSEISSLKATLQGREAEVAALKKAVSDAERRVGEAVELSREEKSRREAVERERDEWARRGREFEAILKEVRAEVMNSEREREALVARAEDAETRAHEAEDRARDAEARAAEAASRVMHTPVLRADGAVADGESLFSAEQVRAQMDEKIHSLSTELHSIYKKKHSAKVAGLRKGLEAKFREKTSELVSRIEDLEKKNEDLQLKLDATMSGVHIIPDMSVLGGEKREAQRLLAEDQAALIERQKAELVGRETELRAARNEFAVLMAELERERVEKGELVAAVDEMLALQADMKAAEQSAPQSVASVAPAVAAVDDFRRSVGMNTSGGAGTARPSGLPGPRFGLSGSRIGAPARGGGVGKSRMMSNIERMGSGRAADH